MSHKTSSRDKVDILELGDIYFAYRPRVAEDRVEGIEDVQRLYVIMQPQGEPKTRLLVVGGKRMPQADEHERLWGFVDEVSARPEAIRDELKAEQYETKTRGKRELPEARPVGEGKYAIVRHDDHTHLVYQLELPRQPGEVQEELNIAPEGSYIMSVKDPEQPSPPGLGRRAEQKPDLPSHLRRLFGGRRFIDVDPVDFLDHPGVELVLVGASADVGRELGIDLAPEHESRTRADIFRRLRMERDEHPTEPLFEGRWR